MAVLRPFRGVRYDTDRVDLSNTIVPPYDVIAPDERELFYERDPHNAIRFELTRKVSDEAGTDYAEVGETLSAWLADGALLRDAEPAFYVMSQSFEAPSGERLERVGFFAALRLEDYDARVVRPHERTLAGPKKDRLKVLRASRANLSSVFMLYEDRDDELASVLAAAFDEATVGVASDAGVEYRLARLTGEGASIVERFMADRPVVIADGHHRYETALAYRDEQRAAGNDAADAAHESTLVFFANAYSAGSLLLPIHRVVREQVLAAAGEAAGDWHDRLSGELGWKVEEFEISGEQDIAAKLDAHLAPHDGRPAFAADDGSGRLRVYWKDESLGERLMVRILEDDVLGGLFDLDTDAIRDGAVTFQKRAERAAREVREGDGAVAFYLNALSPDDVFRVTGEGEVMPQKSTFFYPKIPTGMVFRTHDSGDGAPA